MIKFYILNFFEFAKNVVEFYPQISPFEKSHVLRIEGHFNSIFSNKVRFLNKFRNMELFGYKAQIFNPYPLFFSFFLQIS